MAGGWIDDALFVAEYAIEGCISGITAILKLGSFLLSRPLGSGGGLCLYINSGSRSLGAGESGLRRPLPADILTGDVLAQKRELPVHAVKASPQLRQTGLNRPQPSLEAVQAGGKVPARLQSFLANM